MQRAVVFDMGNVPIGWDPHTPYRRHPRDEGALADFFSGFFRTIYKAVTTIRDRWAIASHR